MPEKANIAHQKANIESTFTPKTASHVHKLFEACGFQKIFGRSDVQDILGLKATRSSALIKAMAEKGFVEPVSGFGKGKYRFIPRSN